MKPAPGAEAPSEAAGSGVAVRLSIVVVSWNTRDLLAQCLASVLAGSDLDLESRTFRAPGGWTAEIIVVDNASADDSAGLVADRFPVARLIANVDNHGFAKANNQALPFCRGDAILLLNPDTEVRPGALQALLDFLDAHPAAGGVGARILETDGTLHSSCYREPTLGREIWRLFHLDAVRPIAVYAMERWDVDAPRRVDAVQGACLLLRREAIDRVGPLDEDYFIYSEEIDLCLRLRRDGWEVWWVPGAVILHHGGRSTGQVATPMFLRLYQGKILYFRKNHGAVAAVLYKVILLHAAMARLGLAPLALIERPDRRRQHLALADRYRRLIGALPRF